MSIRILVFLLDRVVLLAASKATGDWGFELMYARLRKVCYCIGSSRLSYRSEYPIKNTDRLLTLLPKWKNSGIYEDTESSLVRFLSKFSQ